jgi:hypothetical protein
MIASEQHHSEGASSLKCTLLTARRWTVESIQTDYKPASADETDDITKALEAL